MTSLDYAKLETVPSRRCIICDSPMSRAFQKHGYWIVECTSCKHRSAELEPSLQDALKVYGDDYFEGGGAGYTNYLQEGELLRARGRKYGELLQRFASPGRLLDVGAAAGFVLSGLCDAGWQGVGLEPNQKMADFAVGSLKVDVRQGVLEDLSRSDQFDAVTMIQVLPHFFNPHAALERAAAVTKPGGVWLIETWDRTSITARAFGKNWHEYSPPSVLQWFGRDGLVKLVARYGFKPVASGRPSKWIAGSHARALLEHSVQGSRLSPLVSLAARLIPKNLAIPYPAEDLCWMAFRKDVGASLPRPVPADTANAAE